MASCTGRWIQNSIVLSIPFKPASLVLWCGLLGGCSQSTAPFAWGPQGPVLSLISLFNPLRFFSGGNITVCRILLKYIIATPSWFPSPQSSLSVLEFYVNRSLVCSYLHLNSFAQFQPAISVNIIAQNWFFLLYGWVIVHEAVTEMPCICCSPWGSWLEILAVLWWQDDSSPLLHSVSLSSLL